MTNNFFSLPEIINFQLSNYMLSISALLLTIITIKIAFSKNLLETIISISVCSLLISLSYLLMDAPDVAMTEVALGACFSTCVYLSFLLKLPKSEKINLKQTNLVIPSITCLIFIIVLTWVGLDLPEYGSVNSPIQAHLSKYYIGHTLDDIGTPSFVAAILASYRGYDTLGETAVILIAGISVLLLLSQVRNRNA